LSLLGHSLAWVFKWEITPRIMIRSKSNHVNHILCTRSAVKSLRSKHWVILCAFTLERHEEVIQVFQIFLE
jgi:hypothetical protein